MVSPGHSSDYADQEDSFLQSPVRGVLAMIVFEIEIHFMCLFYFPASQ